MSMNIDRSLDDIIESKKKTRRSSGRGGARGGGAIGNRRISARKTVTPAVRSASAPQSAAAQKKIQAAHQQQQQGGAPKIPGVPDGLQGSKIIVSNLPEDVTEAQIRELFSTTIGPLKYAQLTFDANGRSKGIATVEFKNLSDGAKAFHQYNKRLIDQKRPMKVEIIVDPSKAPPAPLTSRIAPLPQPRPTPTQPRANGATIAPASRGPITRSGGAAGGATPASRGRGGRGRGRGGRGKDSRPQVSKEDLDQEMSDWAASTTTATAAS